MEHLSPEQLGYGSITGSRNQAIGKSYRDQPDPHSVGTSRRTKWVNALLLTTGAGAVAALAAAYVGGSFTATVMEKSTTNTEFYGTPEWHGVTPPLSGNPVLLPTSIDAGDLGFQALNYYHIRDGKPGSAYPWLEGTQLVEPFSPTALSVRKPIDGMTYQWTITPATDGAKPVTVMGDGAVVMFEHQEENTVMVEELNSDGVIARRFKDVVMCKYVRREIRTLTDEDRYDLLDAMYIMWELGTVEGREKYGPNYMSVWDLGLLHFLAGEDLECDHFHHGLGFLTSHVLITNVFEVSLQTINPRLTMPYWDFTIETAMGPDTDFQKLSPLFRESWFGGHDPEDFQVKDGRWGNLEIPDVSPEMNNDGLGNVYGKLRAPWNTNSRDYISRGFGEFCGGDATSAQSLPSCADHYSLTTDYNTFYGWSWFALVDPHGPIHLWIGGLLDCQDTFNEINGLVGRDTTEWLRMLSIAHRKILYRAGFLFCKDDVPQYLDTFEVFDQGYCGCLNHNFDKGSDDYLEILEVMGVADRLVSAEDYDEDTRREVARLLCNKPVNDGDHVQASSPLDPTFWPTHGTMERLMQYKMLTGTLTDTTWPDHTAVYTDEDGETFDIIVSSDESGQCVGHRGSDKFPFGFKETTGQTLPVTIWGETAIDKFTNREVLRALDPRHNALPYIYDTFTWPHCEKIGYDFHDAWDTAGYGMGAAAAAAAAAVEGESQRVRLETNVTPLGKAGDNYAIFKEGAPRHDPWTNLMEKGL